MTRITIYGEVFFGADAVERKAGGQVEGLLADRVVHRDIWQE